MDISRATYYYKSDKASEQVKKDITLKEKIEKIHM